MTTTSAVKQEFDENSKKTGLNREKDKSDLTTECEERDVLFGVQNETKEVKTAIKGRKLLRKADRLRDQTPEEDSEILEQKKSEVLGKLSNLSESSNNTSNWNNWFSDLKSAAKTATSTTVSHMSQASNKWSFDPKSLLSGATTLTTTVGNNSYLEHYKTCKRFNDSQLGSGLSSVVDNVASVMDSAIGAPPPELMAALVVKDSDDISKDNSNETQIQDKDKDSRTQSDNKFETNSNNSGFGFRFIRLHVEYTRIDRKKD